MSASGSGSEQLLLELPLESALITNDWSPDGRFLMYPARDAQTSRDLWVLPLEGDRKPRVFLKTKFEDIHTATATGCRIAVVDSHCCARSGY
jgi:hypothetical protein